MGSSSFFIPFCDRLPNQLKFRDTILDKPSELPRWFVRLLRTASHIARRVFTDPNDPYNYETDWMFTPEEDTELSKKYLVSRSFSIPFLTPYIFLL